MPEITHRVHKIPFERIGSCNQCDGCREDCLDECPHGTLVDGKSFCTIYETRHLVCKTCSDEFHGGKEITHQICNEFPNHPWLDVIKRGICNYAFTRLDEEGEVSNEPLPFMDLDKG